MIISCYKIDGFLKAVILMLKDSLNAVNFFWCVETSKKFHVLIEAKVHTYSSSNNYVIVR